MSLPFTRAQFFDVFAAYNTSLWPFAVALWLLTAGVVVMVVRGHRGAAHLVSLLLAIHWGWAAVAYHAAFFSKINPAAWLFSALFLVQAGLFVWFGAFLRYSPGRSLRRYLAWLLVGYSLMYPAVVWVAGNVYPRLPTFGVPCPTTILTIGFLLAADRPVPGVLALIPTLWAFIGGSAAFLLGVPADVVMPAAGIWLTASVVRLWYRRWGVTDVELNRPMPGDDEVPNPTDRAMGAGTGDSAP